MGLVRYAVATPIRIAVFNAVALVGYAWVTSPEPVRTAVGEGDVAAVVDLALGVPNLMAVAGAATLLAILWPVLGGGSRDRRRGHYDDHDDYDDGGGFFDGGGGDGGGGGGE